MKFYKNWYFPQTENKFIEYLKNLDTDEYQKNQRDASIKLIDNSRTAIDIGANIGFWARDLCKIFKNVVLFEPHKLNIECLKKNLENYSNFTTYEYALSNFKGIGDLFFESNGLGNNTLYKKSSLKEKIKIKITRLDEFDFDEIDYIKIDVQFHELEVIEGSINTLNKNNPLLCIEAPSRNKEEEDYTKKIKKILKSIHYKPIKRFGKELFFKK